MVEIRNIVRVDSSDRWFSLCTASVTAPAQRSLSPAALLAAAMNCEGDPRSGLNNCQLRAELECNIAMRGPPRPAIVRLSLVLLTLPHRSSHLFLADLQLAAELGTTLLERNKELEAGLNAANSLVADQAQEIEVRLIPGPLPWSSSDLDSLKLVVFISNIYL